MLAIVPYKLNKYQLMLLNTSKDIFFNHEKSYLILANICNSMKILVNIG